MLLHIARHASRVPAQDPQQNEPRGAQATQTALRIIVHMAPPMTPVCYAQCMHGTVHGMAEQAQGCMAKPKHWAAHRGIHELHGTCRGIVLSRMM